MALELTCMLEAGEGTVAVPWYPFETLDVGGTGVEFDETGGTLGADDFEWNSCRKLASLRIFFTGFALAGVVPEEVGVWKQDKHLTETSEFFRK